jgi:hypothetical protein
MASFPTELPFDFEAENVVWALFFKGFAHLVDFLAVPRSSCLKL